MDNHDSSCGDHFKPGVEQVGMAQDEMFDRLSGTLCDPKESLAARFRALFTLRNLGGLRAVESIGRAFGDPSALLKHELAYCLGQMREPSAIPLLSSVLRDRQQEPMVRHEAGEALGAIGSPNVLDVLREYSSDPVIEVAETCQLAVQRIEWLQNEQKREGTNLGSNPYLSVDPAPPSQERAVASLRATLLDCDAPLFDRYRAMFALRNAGGDESALALADGLSCGSALFRHEVAFVLGQMQSAVAVPALKATLSSPTESPMVRHECAEALGAIAQPHCAELLREHLLDPEVVVRESCEVALDIHESETCGEFQYANGLPRPAETIPAN
uniref:deoxyhypusine hydroxylase isoform X2 n=1 Tax=Myxine glutinosa TaxID=7769 RepID=UPI00358EFCC8